MSENCPKCDKPDFRDPYGVSNIAYACNAEGCPRRATTPQDEERAREWLETMEDLGLVINCHHEGMNASLVALLESRDTQAREEGEWAGKAAGVVEGLRLAVLNCYGNSISDVRAKLRALADEREGV